LGGEPEPKTGGNCARFRFQIWGDRSHCRPYTRRCGFRLNLRVNISACLVNKRIDYAQHILW